MEEIIYGLWFHLTMGANNSDIKEILDSFNSFREIYENAHVIADSFKDSVKNKLIEKDLSVAQMEYEKTVKHKVVLISYYDDIYPEAFKDFNFPPSVIYCKGNLKLLEKPKLTIAGTKKCSHDGRKNGKVFAEEIAKWGITPVSGFSSGIESDVCHLVKECIIILPCGIDVTYPAKNFSLKNDVINNGGLIISQQPMGEKAYPYNFVPRNRLLSVLSDYTFIVEAGDPSGTEIIFNLCQEHTKSVFTIPGNIHSPFYAGNNKFLKKGAIPVTEPCDIINFYKLIYPSIKENEIEIKESEPEFSEEVTSDEELVLTSLAEKPMTYDELIDKTKIPPGVMASVLTMLEIFGKIESAGSYFRLK